MQKTTQATQALNFVGTTVAFDGATSRQRIGDVESELGEDTSANIKITSSNGQTVYSGNFAMSDNQANFVWDGKGNDGSQWPDGNYKMTSSARKQPARTYHRHGNPRRGQLRRSHRHPGSLSISGQSYTADQIRRVIRPTAAAA